MTEGKSKRIINMIGVFLEMNIKVIRDIISSNKWSLCILTQQLVAKLTRFLRYDPPVGQGLPSCPAI